MNSHRIGPFSIIDDKPVRDGVYFTSPREAGTGGGYIEWKNGKWIPYKNWGGYRNGSPMYNFWFGVIESAQNCLDYKVK